MLTDIEVKRLEEAEREYLLVCRDLSNVRNSESYQKKFKSKKSLSAEERDEVKMAVEKEEDLDKKSSSLAEEKRILIKKRDGNWKPDESSKWYPEPGYGPSW